MVSDAARKTARWKGIKVHLYEKYKAGGAGYMEWIKELLRIFILDTFDVDRLKELIEKVIVYGDDTMEIAWKVRNLFEREVSV